METAGRRVLVVGLGVSGFAAARVLAGMGARVRVTEAADSPSLRARAESLRALSVEVEIGGHSLEHMECDFAVVSPGIPPHAPVMQALRASGAEILSEVELAYRIASCGFLAVTGTNGKTTTTSLLAAMLERSGRPAVAAGNIGVPLIEAVSALGGEGAVALEVSSFQLETSTQFHPKVAVLLNIAEDHTDWHGSVESYVRAKARITMNQDHEDVFVYNADDDACVKIAASSRARLIPFSATRVPRDGAGYSGGSLVCGGTEVVTCADVPLSGKAGLEDVAAAAAAAIAYGVDVGEVAAAVRGFRPLAHRLELIAELSEVSFFDDSKATNPHATTAAVQGMEDVVLIAGGRSKGMDLSVLAKVVPPVRAVVAMGEAADEVVKVFDGLVDVRRASNMEEAVAHAYDMAKGRGSVLLSPGCASLDMYESYAARGEHFARCVRQLAGEQREREDSHGDA